MDNSTECYGGIVSTLQNMINSESGAVKAYSRNFAGIIAALRDLGKAIDENIENIDGGTY